MRKLTCKKRSAYLKKIFPEFCHLSLKRNQLKVSRFIDTNPNDFYHVLYMPPADSRWMDKAITIEEICLPKFVDENDDLINFII